MMVLTEDNIPEVLDELFELSGKQKYVVAAKADVHKNTLTHWLKGRVTPNLSQFIRVLAVFGKRLEVRDIENRYRR